jgi:3-hydroxypropanoate dehydrogenase
MTISTQSRSPQPNTRAHAAAAHVNGLLALAEDAQRLLFLDARTASVFTPDHVSDEQILAIYELVKWAPTGSNTQPLRMLVVRSRAARQRLVHHLAEGNQEKTLNAPLTLVLAADHCFHDYLPTLVPSRPEAKDYFGANDRLRTETARFNAILQAGYVILGIRAAGFAAGPMGGFDRDGVDQEFFPDGRWQSVLVVNIGRPASGAWYERLPRLSSEDVIMSV